MKKLLLGLLSLLSVSCLVAEDMAIEKIDKVAVIDGIADDEVWKNATSMPNLFTKLNSDGVKAVSNTSMKLFHNGKALYLLFEARENDAKKLVASQKNRDDGVWLDDCVEVMLSSQGNAEPYYHFMVNTLGTQYDSKITKSRVDANWNGNWKAATSKNDNGYIVEMELPFSMFEMANSTTWRMLLARENKVKNEYSCFPNIATATFHTPSRFVNLNGIEVDKDCYVVVPKSCNFEFGGNEAGIITGKLNLNFESFKDLIMSQIL